MRIQDEETSNIGGTEMTEKQKQAIKILNQLRWDNVINENDYFLLLEFIIEQHSTTTYPWTTDPALYPWTRRLTEDYQPFDPIYERNGRVTCDQRNIETILTGKEKQQ